MAQVNVHNETAASSILFLYHSNLGLNFEFRNVSFEGKNTLWLIVLPVPFLKALTSIKSFVSLNLMDYRPCNKKVKLKKSKTLPVYGWKQIERGPGWADQYMPWKPLSENLDVRNLV